MNRRKGFYTTILVLVFGIESCFGQTVSDEAKRYFDRGVAAVEMADSHADYEAAIKEFEQAKVLAKDWPDLFYNLGLVQEKAGRFGEAVSSFRQYLTLLPTAADADAVRSLINKLEYKSDKVNKKNEMIIALTEGTLRKKGGSTGGICHIEKFTQQGIVLSASIKCMVRDYNHTVPVEFDGATLKFGYNYYGCPNLPNYKDYPCTWKILIAGEVIATSPLRFKVKESWTRTFNDPFSETYDAEWEFTR